MIKHFSLFIFISFLFISLSAQNMYSDTSCVDEIIFDNLQKKAQKIIADKIQAADSDKKVILSLMERHFRKSELQDNYEKGLFFLKHLNCSKIISYSFIEMYLDHEPYKSIFVVLETDNERYYIAHFDAILNKGEYLGELKKDYFSEMINYMLPNIKNELNDNYLMYTKISKNKIATFKLVTGINVFIINQIAILSSIIRE